MVSTLTGEESFGEYGGRKHDVVDLLSQRPQPGPGLLVDRCEGAHASGAEDRYQLAAFRVRPPASDSADFDADFDDRGVTLVLWITPLLAALLALALTPVRGRRPILSRSGVRVREPGFSATGVEDATQAPASATASADGGPVLSVELVEPRIQTGHSALPVKSVHDGLLRQHRDVQALGPSRLVQVIGKADVSPLRMWSHRRLGRPQPRVATPADRGGC